MSLASAGVALTGRKQCLAACRGQEYSVETSAATFPVPHLFSRYSQSLCHTLTSQLSPLTSHLRSSDFCTIVDKLNRSCADQTSLTIEQVYPRMCHLVHSYLAGAPCRQRTGNIRLKQSEMSEFNDLILKYTKENILKINIYIKEPFARKYLMVEYASM